MNATRNGLFVDYCAKDFLDGTINLDPWEELAYRRICDMIYATNDQLADDNKKLAWSTKAGRKWSAIKAALIAAGKIEVVDGRLTNARCRAELQKTAQKIAQKALAGRASFEKRKSLKDNETASTAVTPAVPTARSTTQEPNNLREEEDTEAKASGAGAPSGGGPVLVVVDGEPTPEKAYWDLLKQIETNDLDGMRKAMGSLLKRHGHDASAATADLMTCFGKKDPVAWLWGVINSLNAAPKEPAWKKKPPKGFTGMWNGVKYERGCAFSSAAI